MRWIEQSRAAGEVERRIAETRAPVQLPSRKATREAAVSFASQVDHGSSRNLPSVPRSATGDVGRPIEREERLAGARVDNIMRAEALAQVLAAATAHDDGSLDAAHVNATARAIADLLGGAIGAD